VPDRPPRDPGTRCLRPLLAVGAAVGYRHSMSTQRFFYGHRTPVAVALA
jgi:hypothetical protein